MMIKRYRDMRTLKTFEERYQYLKLTGRVGEATFGFDRHLNQVLYNCRRWKQARDEVIIRDGGCDLGVSDYPIYSRIVVHHMNPIDIEDVELDRDIVYDPEFLICTTHGTHNAIHYGDESLLPELPIQRRKNDTCPWR